MLRVYVKFLLFLSSYIPLYIIFIIQNYPQVELDEFFGALTIGVITVLGLMYYLSKSISESVLLQIQQVENINKINLEYFAVYILPFLGINIQSWNTAAALLFLFSIIGFMYVKSDSIFMNPMFTLIGLNIFRLKLVNGEDVVLITRRRPTANQTTSALQLSEGIFVVK